MSPDRCNFTAPRKRRAVLHSQRPSCSRGPCGICAGEKQTQTFARGRRPALLRKSQGELGTRADLRLSRKVCSKLGALSPLGRWCSGHRATRSVVPKRLGTTPPRPRRWRSPRRACVHMLARTLRTAITARHWRLEDEQRAAARTRSAQGHVLLHALDVARHSEMHRFAPQSACPSREEHLLETCYC